MQQVYALALLNGWIDESVVLEVYDEDYLADVLVIKDELAKTF